MKKWTIVIELTDLTDTGDSSDKEMIEMYIQKFLSGKKWFSAEIMETIEAPYGPELPGGVYLDVREGPKKVRR